MSAEVDIVTVETVEGEASGNGANRYGIWRENTLYIGFVPLALALGLAALDRFSTRVMPQCHARRSQDGSEAHGGHGGHGRFLLSRRREYDLAAAKQRELHTRTGAPGTSRMA